MFNLEYRHALQDNTFTRYNDIDRDVRMSEILYPPDSKMIPLIYTYMGSMHFRERVLYLPTKSSFNNRKVSKAQMNELFSTALIPALVRYNTSYYIVGKGLLGEYIFPAGFDANTSFPQVNRPYTIDWLAWVTVPNTPRSDAWNTGSEIIVNRKLYLPVNRLIQSCVGPLIDSAIGDTLITNHIDDFIGKRLKPPAFRTITQQKEWTNNALDFAIRKFAA